jgi:hypothetical protein
VSQKNQIGYRRQLLPATNAMAAKRTRGTPKSTAIANESLGKLQNLLLARCLLN